MEGGFGYNFFRVVFLNSNIFEVLAYVKRALLYINLESYLVFQRGGWSLNIDEKSNNKD